MTRPPTSALLSPELHARVSSELESGERLLWEGQPRLTWFTGAGCAMSVFGLFFGGFALFWIATAAGMLWGGHQSGDGPPGAFSFFPLFGLPFLLVGLGMVLSPIWLRRAAARTAYAVTDKRVLILQGKPWAGVEVRSLSPADLTQLTRTERADGSGDLVFEELWETTFSNTRGGSTPRRTRIGFLGIEQVRQVESLIRAQHLKG